MKFILGDKSLANLQQVHESLVDAVHIAIRVSAVDFGVHEGVRSMRRQREYVARGVSKTMDSKHMIQADDFAHAVDLVPYIDGQLRWEVKPCIEIAVAMHYACKTQNLSMTWGACWDSPFELLIGNARGLENEVNAYVDRRRAIGKTAFLDYPHYELREE